MKKSLLGLLAVFGCFSHSFAHATPITYDITVAGGNWVTVGATVFGLSGQNSLFGSVTVDNALSGIAAFKNFSFTTGVHTWTLSEFVGPTALALFDAQGFLAQFSLANFAFGNASMYFYSNNTTAIYSGDDWYFCNACVSIKRGIVRDIPEPATLALVGLGIVWLGVRASRKKK